MTTSRCGASDHATSRVPAGSAAAADIARLADAIVAALRERPLFFMDLVRAHRHLPYRTLLLAWGAVRDREKLERDDEGRYFLPPKGDDR